MAQRVSKYPDLPAKELRGLSERSAPGSYPPGVFDLLRGLYPARNGLLQRIPPHSQLATIGGRILQIHATGNTNTDILIQTDAGIYAYTLDELLARTVTPSITYPPLSEEETMSMAIIVQREANNVVGGSIDGVLSGTSTASANTFYGRRLTNMLCNESANGVPTVVSPSGFTASTGGTSAVSTAGTFQLVPGTYRIRGTFLFNSVTASASFLCGLYNATTALFECHYDGASNNIPILGTVVSSNALVRTNMMSTFEARILVSSTNKTFQIMQETADTTVGQALKCCGDIAGTLTTANVNSAAAGLEYGRVTILRTA